MTFDLRSTPFSTKGSYQAISYLEGGFRGRELESGLYLRSVQGKRDPVIGRLIPLLDGKPCAYETEAQPHLLTVKTPGGTLRFTFASADTLLIEGRGVGLRFDFLPGGSSFNLFEPVLGEGTWYLVNSFKSLTRYMLGMQEGRAEIDQDWNGEETTRGTADLLPEDGRLLVVWQEILDEWLRPAHPFDFEAAAAASRASFAAFLDGMPSVPAEWEPAREISAYVDYSAYIQPHCLLRRPAMLMSKNWMCRVWSWDHCFNAMALAYRDPEAAWDQFLLPFDYQSPTGRIPDSVEAYLLIDNYCKPPIHGWALGILRRLMPIGPEKLADAYAKLSRFTEWWLNYRDQDRDGLCEYTHGNDSGWDNSTAFLGLPPVATPDLAALLILQMDELADVAETLGRHNDAASWRARSDAMLRAATEKLFDHGRPLSIQAATGKEIPNDSLLPYLSVLLGDKLPAEARDYMLDVLKSDKFLTPHGYATESPKSPRYESDGYWRGPIWAPSTMLLLDGLRRCGETELAAEVTRRFCALVQNGGCAENFDALTGEALRDKAYTWTGSIMMVMAHEYL